MPERGEQTNAQAKAEAEGAAQPLGNSNRKVKANGNGNGNVNGQQDTISTVAVVGGGISGLSAAWALTVSKQFNKVVLFESEPNRLGGHALTVDVDSRDSCDSCDSCDSTSTAESTKRQKEMRPKDLVSVDLGFQVFNLTTYPYLTALFSELGVDTEPSDMSFALSTEYECECESSSNSNNGNVKRLEWASHGLDSVFAQRGNLLSPSFLHMVREIFRFANCSPEVLLDDWHRPDMTLGEYLKFRGFTEDFAKRYLLPMTAAVWSVPNSKMLQFPVAPLIKFWKNHHLLNPLGSRPRWRVVTSRSRAYVDAIKQVLIEHGTEIRTGCPVESVAHSTSTGVGANDNGTGANGDRVRLTVRTGTGTGTQTGTGTGTQKEGKKGKASEQEQEQEHEHEQEQGSPSEASQDCEVLYFDHVVLACHAPTSAKVVRNGMNSTTQDVYSYLEKDCALLDAIQYQPNEVVLHSDVSQMPQNRKAWASWNVIDRRTKTPNGVDPDQRDICVTYWLNRLQNLPEGSTGLRLCTLNPIDPIPEQKVLYRTTLEHPIFTTEAIEAQQQLNELQAHSSSNHGSDSYRRRIWYAGAYLGSGFHEDGIRSAFAVSKSLGAAPHFVHVEHPALQLVRGPDPSATLKHRLLLRVFESIASAAFAKGHMRIVEPSGDEIGPFGRKTLQDAIANDEPAVMVWIQDLDMLMRVVKDSDIGLGSSYITKLFRVDSLVPENGSAQRRADQKENKRKPAENTDNGIVELLDLLALNMEQFQKVLERGPFKADSITMSIGSVLYKFGNSVNNLYHQMRKNTVAGSRKNIEEHYDLGNELYSLFLDETMCYSAAIHTIEGGRADEFKPESFKHVETPEQRAKIELPLKEAQLAKLDAIIARAELKPHHVVLEVGCGWGPFAIRAASTVGCRVIGITISTEQLNLARERVSKLNLEDKIDLRICDYRMMGLHGSSLVDDVNDAQHNPSKIQREDDVLLSTPGSFDRIVSIEMLEAVGHEHFPQYFDMINRMLKPGGNALIQVIGIADERYEAYMRGSDFIRRFIFPGGHLPCLSALKEAITETDLALSSVDDIGLDYAVTLRMWRENFMNARDKILELGYPEHFIRMWEFYFAYCEVGFARGKIFDWQLRFDKRKYASATSMARSDNTVARHQEPSMPLEGAASTTTEQADTITQVLLALWFMLCAITVAKLGSHLLVVPGTMLLSLLLSYACGATDVKHRTRNRRRVGLDISTAIGWSILVAGLSYHWLYGRLSSELADYSLSAHVKGSDPRDRSAFSVSATIVMVGTGLYGAELIATVVGRTFNNNKARLIFLIPALICLTAATVTGIGFPHLTLFGISESTGALVALRNVLAFNGYQMRSLAYQLVWGLVLIGVIFIRLVPHFFLLYQVLSDLMGSQFSWQVCLASAGMIGAVIYDVTAFIAMCVSARTDYQNAWNTDELIKGGDYYSFSSTAKRTDSTTSVTNTCPSSSMQTDQSIKTKGNSFRRSRDELLKSVTSGY